MSNNVKLLDIYRYGFNGKEKENELNEQNYNFGARIYDSRIGRWLSRDPMESKYPSHSTYNAFVNDPIGVIDPDGADIIILRHSNGAGTTGHGAILVGNDKTGWTYISKDGYAGSMFGSKSLYVVKTFATVEEFRNSPHNFILADGKHSTSEGKQESSFNYALDSDGNKKQRYDKALYIATTQENGWSTDKLTIAAAEKSAKSDYCLMDGDCSDVVSDALHPARDNMFKKIWNGETGYTKNALKKYWGERPNTKFNKIKDRNTKRGVNVIEFDNGVIPDDKELKSDETGKKSSKK